jgi:hypothetical protein
MVKEGNKRRPYLQRGLSQSRYENMSTGQSARQHNGNVTNSMWNK